MGKLSSFPQNTRMAIGRIAADTSYQTVFKAEMPQQMNANDAHFHAEKLGLGDHGAHEGRIKAEEVRAAPSEAVNAEARHNMIKVTAYYLAEKRGFADHGAYEDWLKAENEIDAILYDHI